MKPLLLTILTAIILVYVISPVYRLFNTRIIKNRYICSIAVLIIIFAVFSIPVLLLLHSLSQQGYEQYLFLKDFLSNPDVFECPEEKTEFCSVYVSFVSQEGRTVLQEFFKKSVIAIGQKILSTTIASLASLPTKLLDFFVMIFLMFFLFVDGEKLFKTVKNFLPMKIEHEEYLINTLKETTDAVVFGQVFIAVLEGFLAAVGFWILGIQHAILLGSIIAFLGVIPFFGPTIVWAPLALYFLILGIQNGEVFLMVKAALIIGYGVLVLGTIENFLKPKIIGDKAKLHPAMVFVGVLGGISLFGFIGFFLGPIILAVFVTLIKIYEKEKILQLKSGR